MSGRSLSRNVPIGGARRETHLFRCLKAGVQRRPGRASRPGAPSALDHDAGDASGALRASGGAGSGERPGPSVPRFSSSSTFFRSESGSLRGGYSWEEVTSESCTIRDLSVVGLRRVFGTSSKEEG